MNAVKTRNKVLLTAAGVTAVLAAAAGAYLLYYTHKDRLVLYDFTKQRDDGTYYALAHDTESYVHVETEVDLTPYLTVQDAVLTVEGEVTSLRIRHFDCMGIYLPCLSYDYCIHAVISAETAAP